MAVALICKKVSEATGTETKVKTVEKEDPVIVCRRCNGLVTRPEHCITVTGRFAHTFANPHGQVFEIGCFSSAQGCARSSEASDDFSWFKGYLWAVGLCRSCHTQLGWVSCRQGQGIDFTD